MADIRNGGYEVGGNQGAHDAAWANRPQGTYTISDAHYNQAKADLAQQLIDDADPQWPGPPMVTEVVNSRRPLMFSYRREKWPMNGHPYSTIPVICLYDICLEFGQDPKEVYRDWKNNLCQAAKEKYWLDQREGRVF